MRKYGIIAAIVVVAGGAALYYFNGSGADAATSSEQADIAAARRERSQMGGGPGMGGGGRGGGFAGPRPPMTVEMATVTRGDMADTVTVVGNLIGAATVDAVPRAAGRLQDVYVKMGDQVRMGQRLARIEDREILEQVKQAEASYGVSQASIRQRQADLKLALNNLERSKSLYERDLLPRQTFDDTDSRYQAAQAQLDLAIAQMEQSKARLDELKINLSNTIIASPVDGFVGKRTLDPGASVGINTSFISVVDIRTVRLVINVVERDLRRITQGTNVSVEVDAYPGETFTGRVARVAPILDPATRTAQVEIEIPNHTYRLKPGMYARATFTVEKHEKALIVPTISVVDVSGKIGVFIADGETARFHQVTTGIEHQDFTEVVEGLQEGQKVISTGAAALREGDRIALPGANARGGRGGRGGRRGGGGGSNAAGAPAGSAPAADAGEAGAAPNASQGNVPNIQPRTAAPDGASTPSEGRRGGRGRRGGQD
jgi:RND family efflux transporter MFP subunit